MRVSLEWRFEKFFGAFFGAMGLSNLMGLGDLMLLIGIHWFVTFLNTPVPPSNTQNRLIL